MNRLGIFTASFSVFGALFSIAFSSPVLAGTEWSDCSSGDPDRIVAGCSSILASKTRIPPKQMAVAYVNRGIAFFDKGELEKSLADYSAAIKVDPKNPDARHNRADLRFRMGQLELAVEDYSEAIKLSPKTAGPYNGRGNALRESGYVDRAIADYTQAIKLDPKSPFPYNGRGNALRDKGQLEQAIADYDKAIELDPKYTNAWIGRANASVDKRDWPSALKGYEVAISLDPKDATAYNNRGAVYRELGKLEEAIQDYDNAVAFDPTRAAFYFNRALAFHLSGAVDRALEDYSETIRRDPKYASAYHLRGVVRQSKGELATALEDYSRALEINPNYAQSLTSRGTVHLRQGDMKRAVEDLKASIRLDPAQAPPHVALGEAYGQLGSPAQGITELDRALELDPAASEAYLQRGRLFEITRKDQQASADYEAALALDPNLEPAKTALRQIALRTKTVMVEKPATSVRLNRVALVIGNGDYKTFGQLANARRDAAAVSESLEKIGFRQVIKVEDQGRAGMLSALREFREMADSADWAVVYYAGHGIEIEGTNYLVPTDAKLATDRDVPDEAVELQRLLVSIQHAKQMKLVILDACRDNPFLSRMKVSAATRSIGRGLGRVEPEGSVLVAYAAKHGQISRDGVGEHSPFVASLLKRVATPGLEIRKLFGLVRDDVLAATDRQQEPFIYGTLGGEDYVLNPAKTF